MRNNCNEGEAINYDKLQAIVSNRTQKYDMLAMQPVETKGICDEKLSQIKISAWLSLQKLASRQWGKVLLISSLALNLLKRSKKRSCKVVILKEWAKKSEQ